MTPILLKLPEQVIMQVLEFSPYFYRSLSKNYLFIVADLPMYSAFSNILYPSTSSLTISFKKFPYISKHLMWLGFISFSFLNRSLVLSTVLVILLPNDYNFWISGFSSRSSLQNSRWRLTDFSMDPKKITNLFWKLTIMFTSTPFDSEFLWSDSIISSSIRFLYL